MKHIRIYTTLVAVLMLGALAGCAKKQPPIEPLPGDSIQIEFSGSEAPHAFVEEFGWEVNLMLVRFGEFAPDTPIVDASRAIGLPADGEMGKDGLLYKGVIWQEDDAGYAVWVAVHTGDTPGGEVQFAWIEVVAGESTWIEPLTATLDELDAYLK